MSRHNSVLNFIKFCSLVMVMVLDGHIRQTDGWMVKHGKSGVPLPLVGDNITNRSVPIHLNP